jgi:hypothetical protein
VSNYLYKELVKFEKECHNSSVIKDTIAVYEGISKDTNVYINYFFHNITMLKNSQ